MLTGNNGILTRATQAKEATREGEVQETVRLEATNNTASEYIGGGKKDRAQVISELREQEKLTPEEVKQLTDKDNPVDVITIGGVTIDFSVLGSNAKTLIQAFNDGDIKIGDYINYTPSNTSASVTILKDGIKNQTTAGIGTGYDAEQTFTVDTTSDYKTTWRVLGLNEAGTNLMLISGSPIRKTGDDPYLVLQGAESYVYCKKTLDAICNIYANTNLADEVRSITMEDINTALGVKVDYTTNTDETKTPSKVYEKENPELNIDAYNGVESYEYKSGNFAPENYLGTGNKKIGNKVYRTAYWYNRSSLTKSDNTAKGLIFDGTTDTTNYSKSYWVASPGANADSSYAYFGPGSVGGGNAFCGRTTLFYSDGDWFANDFAVRPVVSLRSNITTEQLQVQSGIEEKNWSTSVGNNYLTGSLDASKAINE